MWQGVFKICVQEWGDIGDRGKGAGWGGMGYSLVCFSRFIPCPWTHLADMQ